jgi:hypothetical protein
VRGDAPRGPVVVQLDVYLCEQDAQRALEENRIRLAAVDQTFQRLDTDIAVPVPKLGEC